MGEVHLKTQASLITTERGFQGDQKSTEDEYLRGEENQGGLLRGGNPTVNQKASKKDEKGSSHYVMI